MRGEAGPTGGPAFTDVLGLCTAWADGVCVVEPSRGGPPVTVPVADIVSGKPVPPRPSVRHRVSARDAESHTAALFGSVEVVPLGDWAIRWEPVVEGRARKRANSCLAMGSPGVPVSAALEQVADFYRSRERPAYVQVEQGSDVESAVVGAGWRPVAGGDAAYLLASTALLSRDLRPTDGLVPVADEGSGAVRAVVPGERPGGPAIAEGRAALDGDWLGVHGLVVAPQHRRRGLARAVMAALVAWGAEQGARTVWLHVETDNAPALAFYDVLGFAEHHRCRYYSPA